MRPSIYLKNLQSSSNWRAQYNPLRGLTLPLLVALLESGERGNYARLQWLYRFIEKRNPTLRAVLQRRQGSLTKLDWNVSVSPGAGSDPRALGARQAALLRAAYERVENLREAVILIALRNRCKEYREAKAAMRHLSRPSIGDRRLPRFAQGAFPDCGRKEVNAGLVRVLDQFAAGEVEDDEEDQNPDQYIIGAAGPDDEAGREVGGVEYVENVEGQGG